MKIKVCGIKQPEIMAAIVALGVDYVGHIFYPCSVRHTEEHMAIPLRQLESGRTARVGVFVNRDLASILRYVGLFGLNVVQLHGDESPATCRAIMRRCPVIKAIPVRNAQDVGKAQDYEGSVDYLLFDTKTANRGGSGGKFDWQHLADYHGSVPFFISGGIGPGDAGLLKEIRHDKLYGVDVNSRFENAPGIKDINMLSQFINQLRAS